VICVLHSVILVKRLFSNFVKKNEDGEAPTSESIDAHNLL
jgi:hypothetical protein